VKIVVAAAREKDFFVELSNKCDLGIVIAKAKEMAYWEVTQKLLQTETCIVRKPRLTEVLLKKPPFRFLHDVISEVKITINCVLFFKCKSSRTCKHACLVH
jgi:hypothetical protein